MNTNAISESPVFISSVYESGVSLRADIADWQFTIFAKGIMKFADEYADQFSDGYMYQNRSVQISKISDIASAVLLAEFMHNNNAWEIRDPNKDYYDPDSKFDSGPLDFKCDYLVIKDRHGKIVLSGEVRDSKICWISSIFGTAQVKQAVDQMGALEAQAREEMRGDNYDSARWLRQQKEKISSRIVTSKYCRSRIIAELFDASQMNRKDLDFKLRLAIAKCDLLDRSHLPF